MNGEKVGWGFYPNIMNIISFGRAGYLYNENTINQQLDYLKTEIEETIVILKKAKFFSKGYFFQFFVQNYIDTVIINYLPQFRVFPFLLLVWFF